MPQRGKDLGGFTKTDGLESRGSDPRLTCLHVMRKDVGEGTWKIHRISSSLLALRLRQEAAMYLGHGLFCKYSKIPL